VTVLGSEQKIDIIFAEVRLSGSFEGFGFAQWVRQNHSGVDVILTSGIAKAAGTGGDLCDEGPLEKPCHRKRFCAAAIFFLNDDEQRNFEKQRQSGNQ